MSTGRTRQTTRERLLEAGLDLFVEQGFTGTSISDVERRVGLAAGSGSFYRHFPSKEELLRAAVAREVELRMAEAEAERASLPVAEDGHQQFVVSAQQVLRDLRRFDRLFHLFLTEGDRVPEVREAIITALQGSGAVSWVDEPVLFVSIAALAGYHLFGRMDGGTFQAMEPDAFIDTLARLMSGTAGAREPAREG
jgi:AcrR family transcriptional regulator